MCQDVRLRFKVIKGPIVISRESLIERELKKELVKKRQGELHR